MIPVGRTTSTGVRWVQEVERIDGDWEFQTQHEEVVVRDWDVTDAEARATAAEEQLGEGVNDDEWYAQCAMWFIHAEANAAVLAVFRPKPKNAAVHGR